MDVYKENCLETIRSFFGFNSISDRFSIQCICESPKESDMLLSNTVYLSYWHHKTIRLQATHKQKQQTQQTHSPKTIPHFHRKYSLLKWRESTKPYKSCQKNMDLYGHMGQKHNLQFTADCLGYTLHW